MSEGSRSKLLLPAAVAAVLFVSMSAAGAPEPAGAQKCNPVCLPPPEEEENPGGGGGGEPQPAGETMLVINVGWSTGLPATSSPLVESNLDANVSYLRGSVNEWFRNAAPGIFHDWRVARGGSYTVAAPKVLAATGTCTSNDSFFPELSASADAAARQHGIDPDGYDVVVYVWTSSICTYSGITDRLNGHRLGLQKASAAEHELGHLMGLPHATALSCADALGHQTMPMTGECKTFEYGDLFDMMGSTTLGLPNAMYENALGWMKGQVVNLSAGDYTQSVTLKPLSEPGQSPRAVRLVDGSTKLWLEYRRPTGLDTPQVPGLTYGLFIHRELERGTWDVPTSQMLDMSPDTGSEDPGLRVGQTWADPGGEMKIALNSAGAAGATVTISTQRVTVPDVRGYSPARAEAAIAAAGLTPGAWESTIDPTCTLIGLVAGENPPAGSRVFPGSSVRIVLGEQDPTRACQ